MAATSDELRRFLMQDREESGRTLPASRPTLTPQGALEVARRVMESRRAQPCAGSHCMTPHAAPVAPAEAAARRSPPPTIASPPAATSTPQARGFEAEAFLLLDSRFRAPASATPQSAPQAFPTISLISGTPDPRRQTFAGGAEDFAPSSTESAGAGSASGAPRLVNTSGEADGTTFPGLGGGGGGFSFGEPGVVGALLVAAAIGIGILALGGA